MAPWFRRGGTSMARICKILVVEDNEGIRDFLSMLFDDQGYKITLVGGGNEMRAALAREHFDVALIDVTLPGPDDGFCLAELAKSAGCGVILVTGDSRHFDTIQVSGHRHLLKPFRIEQLLRLVNELIERSDCTASPRQATS